MDFGSVDNGITTFAPGKGEEQVGADEKHRFGPVIGDQFPARF